MEEIDTTESDEGSLEDLIESLKRNAFAVDQSYKQAVSKLKAVRVAVLEEQKSMSEVPLQPRTRLMKWLTDRGLPVDCSFREFFQTFLQEHKEESRLELETRVIRLSKSGAVLLGKAPETRISLGEFFQSLSSLYV